MDSVFLQRTELVYKQYGGSRSSPSTGSMSGYICSHSNSSRSIVPDFRDSCPPGGSVNILTFFTKSLWCNDLERILLFANKSLN